LLLEDHLPVPEAQRHQVAVVVEVEEFLARAAVLLAGEVRENDPALMWPGQRIGPALLWRLMKSMAAAEVSSSIVSIRFFVSGPVSSMLCLPTLPQRG
jgi:hypothetical protein